MKEVRLGKGSAVVLVTALNIVAGTWDFAACIDFPPFVMIAFQISLGKKSRTLNGNDPTLFQK